MIRLAAALALVAAPALAGEITLTGAEIGALLPGIVVEGEGTSQTFDTSGATFYVSSERPSTGRWWVEGNRYCSTWPPSDEPTCYGVARDGDQLIWISPSGHREINQIRPR